ncbi:MAG: gamma-glutamyl-gamma-aminobutyrate hydrolase family protein [Bacteroidales bacterium]
MNKGIRFCVKIALILFIISHIFSCYAPEKAPARIVISKSGSFYEQWLHNSDSTLILTSLYDLGLDSALKVLELSQGLLLTGGEDIFPDLYGMIHDTVRCGEFDHYRDSLEISLIHKALEMNIPIMGICRGHQILNVALGGTMIIDIPEDVGMDVIHRDHDDPLACVHEVSVAEGSFLNEITACANGIVTSNHHQAIRDLAPGLRVSSTSSDGVIEAIEWADRKNKAFLIGVQWHPERMNDHPELSRPIADKFISEAKK